MLGETKEELGGTQYLSVVHHREQGLPPELVLDAETALYRCVLELTGSGLVESAHDCSDGGLAVALAECCMSADTSVGAVITVANPHGIRRDAILFGESQSRVALSVKSDAVDRVLAVAARWGVPADRIGETGGDRLSMTVAGEMLVDGKTYKLPTPFMVIATQNPFEYEGTYVLPESQMDRFLLRISMGYPSRDDERQVLVSHRFGQPVDDLQPVLNCEQIIRLQRAVREVTVEDSLYEYLLNMVDATRNCDELHVGVSTRGALSLFRASQAAALIHGRSFVTPDDVKQLAVHVLSHRVITKSYVQGKQRESVETLLRRLIDTVAVPT